MRFVDVSGKLGQINKSIRESAQNRDEKNEIIANRASRQNKVSSILAQRITDKPMKAVIKGYKTLSERNRQKYDRNMEKIGARLDEMPTDKLKYKTDRAQYKYDKQEYKLGNLEKKPVNPFYARARQNAKNAWDTTKSLPGRAVRALGNGAKMAGKAIIGLPIMVGAGLARLTGRGAVKTLAAGVRATRTIKNKVHDMNVKSKFQAAKGTLSRVTKPVRDRIKQEVFNQDLNREMKNMFKEGLSKEAPSQVEQQQYAVQKVRVNNNSKAYRPDAVIDRNGNQIEL